MGFSRQEYWSGVPLPSPKHSVAHRKSYFFSHLNSAASAGREWEWRARPPPPCHSPPRFLPSPLPPLLPLSLLALPGSGRALAGLRIAHSGGAAVFVGWGSGLPLAAGIRVQPG